MPRKTADVRHTDSAPPTPIAWPPGTTAIIDALLAAQHPARRRLYELLLTEGPASVGTLARRTGLAPGSVSHHLKPLHRNGFVEPDPDAATGDGRKSWWRAVHRRLSWNSDNFAAGTVGREISVLAEQANQAYHDDALRDWLRTRDDLPRVWRDTALVTDAIVAATPEQAAELGRRIVALIDEWSATCRADAATDPTLEGRRTVRAYARVFPSDPGSRQ